MMQQLTSSDFDFFITAKPAAVILFDAEWDVEYRPIARKRMLQAQELLGQSASFGEADCDSHPELVKSIPVMNVPLVAYFRNGKLVAALIGVHQNVKARLERVLRGEPIGYKDGNDESPD